MNMKTKIALSLAALAASFAANAAVPLVPGWDDLSVSLECAESNGWTLSAATNRLADGRSVYAVSFARGEEAAPPKTRIRFSFPQRRVRHLWSVNDNLFPISPFLVSRRRSSLCENMPLYAFIDDGDANRLTFGASECARDVEFRGGVHEEGCDVTATFDLFTRPEAPIRECRVAFCIDASDRHFSGAVSDMALWMEREAGYVPCEAPPAAFKPLYSTWYGFHQNVTAASVEAECRAAAALGMETVILDDGWQTDDGNRGYRFCGDWRPTPAKFPDMAAHVAAVRAAGMKYMVWYSVPFIGHDSDNAARFKGKYLYDNKRLGAYVLDPRFPEVRRFLADTYAAAARDWGLDGFKLDFIDSFRITGDDPAVAENYAGRDVKSVPFAVDALMKEVRAAILAVRPDALIEFRQSYVGPAIRQYGNMLRAGDCPGDMRQNRVAMANLRLVSGRSAVHADMLEWHMTADAEDAALNIISSMFGTVQYSQILRDSPERHVAAIRHWIAFTREHENALQHGWIRPRHPELSYPVIEAGDGKERIVAVYAQGVVADLGDGAEPVAYLVNGTDADGVAVRLQRGVKAVFRDTFGNAAGEGEFAPGLREIPVPKAGYAVITFAAR